MLNAIIFLSLAAAQAPAAQSAPVGQPASIELGVKGAGSRGTLAFTSGEVEFKATDAKKAKTWRYQDLQQIRVESPRKIVLETFVARSRGRGGMDRTETFEVTSGAVTGDMVAFLLTYVTRPVPTSVLPANIADPLNRVPVRHHRFGHGSNGTLALYAAGLAYVSDKASDSRFWRFADLQSVLRTSPFELLVTAYEGGDIRTYAFDLKAPFPSDAFDTLWARVNPATPRNGGVR